VCIVCAKSLAVATVGVLANPTQSVLVRHQDAA